MNAASSSSSARLSSASQNSIILCRSQIAAKDVELTACKSQIVEVERKLAEACRGDEASNGDSAVIASMRRLQVNTQTLSVAYTSDGYQGLLHSRERDLRKSQLRICELEGMLSTASSDPAASRH